MVKIILTEKADGAYELHAKGHAGYRNEGHDIVCAAVSILLYAMIESIDKNDICSPFVAFVEKGNSFIRVKPKEKSKGKLKGILHVICKGFELLQNNFPQNVKFTRFGG